jgi:hypothetical protein
MKLQTHPVTWAHASWPSVSIDERSFRTQSTPVLDARRESVNVRSAASSSLSTPLRVVRILAFCQAIIFLVLFLFVCAWAGAATERKSTVDLQVISSSYAPKKERNPFGSGTVDAVGSPAKVDQVIAPGLLKLSGILYDPVHPSAVVNGQLVELKKAVRILTEQGELEVKALRITRESVLLEIGNREHELWLSGHEPDKQNK